MTYREFNALLKGYVFREERDRYTEAWKLSVLMQPYAEKGKTLSPEDFFNETKREQVKKTKIELEYERVQERNRRREEGLPPLPKD